METKEFRLELKDVDEAGTFVGMASVYGNVDLQGDRIQEGAFKHTLRMNEGEVPILWHHRLDMPIGAGKLEDTERGLKVNGVLDLNIKLAQEAYSLLKPKANFKRPVLRGLSIGYETVKSDFVDGVRVLKELKLFEVSLVTLPANPKATVQRVKEFNPAPESWQKIIEEIASIKASLLREGIDIDPDMSQSMHVLSKHGPGTWNGDPPDGAADNSPVCTSGQSLMELWAQAKAFTERLKHGRGHHPGSQEVLR